MGTSFSLEIQDDRTPCIIPNDILMLILRKLDSHTLISIVPLICRRLSTMCISSIDGKDLNSSFLWSRRNVKKFSDIIVPEGLFVHVLTLNSDPDFGLDDIYSMIISSHANVFGLATLVTNFFNQFSTQKFKSLKSLMLLNMSLGDSIMHPISYHELECLHLNNCYILHVNMEKLALVKEFYLTLKSTLILQQIYLPQNIERLVVLRPTNIDMIRRPPKIDARYCKNLRHM